MECIHPGNKLSLCIAQEEYSWYIVNNKGKLQNDVCAMISLLLKNKTKQKTTTIMCVYICINVERCVGHTPSY